MRNREPMTDEEVLDECQRLTRSDAVRLARKEQRLLYKARQYLYTLRNLEKRGLALMEKGITFDNVEERLFGDGTVSDEFGQTVSE